MIRVGVVGAAGRMGSTVCDAVEGAEDMEVLARVDLGDALDLLDECDVVVDFTAPDVVMRTIEHCIPRGVHVVVGTSGFDSERLGQVEPAAGTRTPGVLVAPNFSIGAVLMMRFAAVAAPFFESVEIVEMHHPDKVDAPSGTATRTAELIARLAKGGPPRMPPPPRWRVPAGPPWTMSRCTPCDCGVWWPTRRCSSAERGRL